ncbi:MAG: hypothetical protein QXD69_04815 [Candidatus Bathyarchaeia archaeon]
MGCSKLPTCMGFSRGEARCRRCTEENADNKETYRTDGEGLIVMFA